MKLIPIVTVTLTTLISASAPTSAVGAIAPLPGPFGAKSTLLSPTTKSTSALAPAPAKSAAIEFTCSDLRRAALKMSAHTSNLANRKTTRTIDGGPYKRLEVTCKAAGAFCDIQKVDESQIVFEPNHPDADENGYVKYPVINVGNESAGLNSAADEIKAIASQGVCGTKIIENGLLTIVKYDQGFDVMMDTITFTPEGRIARWSRTTREGKTQNLSFKDDGTPVSL